MATEIADAYVALYTKMPGVKGDIEKALGGAEDVVEKSGKSFGSKLMDGFSSAGKVSAIGLGGALAAGVGTALVKGFQRLDALDQATAKLTGLGHSAETVDQIMNNALASVKGTAFGMGEAAGAAGILVGAGVQQGETLERALKLTADAATIAGTDMGSMGAIFGKVAAKGKLDGDVMAQLLERQIGILPQLADYYGVTTEEASKMVSEGKVNFEDFANVMESTLGGAALASGDTFSGAMDNVMASLGRIGEGLLKGIFPDMKDGLQGLIEAMEPLEQVARDVGQAIGEFVGFIKENIDWIGPLATGIMIAVGALAALNIIMWILSINPITLLIMAIVLAVGLLIGAIILLVQNWDTVIAWIGEVWEGFVTWLGEVWEGFVGWITGVWEGFMAWITGVLEGFVGWWNSIWSAVGKFISDVWNNIVNWVRTAVDNVFSFINTALGNIRGAWEAVWNGIGNFLRGVWNNILGWIEGGVNGAIDLINGMIGGISDVAAIIGIEVGTIPHVRIPRLAEGGVVSRRPGGILANIGEGKYDEAVVPLSPEVLSKLGGGKAATVNIYPTFQQADSRLQMRQWGREAERALAAI